MYAWSRLLDAVVRARRWDAVRQTLAARTRLHEWCERGDHASMPLDVVCLESRILYSATPLTELFASVAEEVDSHVDQHSLTHIDTLLGHSDGLSEVDHHEIHHAPLAGGTGVPTIDLPDQVTIDEDRPSAPILIRIHDSDTAPENWNITVTSSNQAIVRNDHIVIRGDGDQRSLLITPERDKFGVPVTITVAVSDGTHTTTDSFGLAINPINDRPEAVNLPNINVLEGTNSSVINLHAAFHDVDNADSQLTYSIAAVSNPSLFSRITLDQAAGRLTLTYATGVSGSANVTLRATDPSGAYVEIGPSFKPMKIYEAISADNPVDMPDTTALGIEKISLFTQWALFDLVNGEYDYSYVNYALLERVLTNYAPTGIPVAIDIENEEYFGNTPEGRDHLGDVIRFARALRPDLEMGFYTLMPTGNWWTPMYQHRMQMDLAAGLNTWYTQNADRFNREYQDWKDANALYRDSVLPSDPDGKTLGDYIQNTQPSLYTPYRHFWTKTYEARDISINPTTDRITSPFAYQNGMSVVFTRSPEDILPSQVDGATRLYVVNASGGSFQLSTTPNGVGIDFDLPTVTNSQLSRWLALTDDIDVRDWHAYAEYNVAEALKFGDMPVYGWISPSIRGNGLEYIEGEYFRQQLEILSKMTDGIVLYESYTQNKEFHENQAWWHELTDFVEKQNAHSTWFTVNVINVNQRPVAVNDSYLVSAGSTLNVGGRGVLANDTDPDSTTLTVRSATAPQAGTLTWQANGTFVYRNTNPAATTDSFNYVVVDNTGMTAQGTVRIRITNHYYAAPPPVAVSNMPSAAAAFMVGEEELNSVAAPTPSQIHYAPLSEAFVRASEVERQPTSEIFAELATSDHRSNETPSVSGIDIPNDRCMEEISDLVDVAWDTTAISPYDSSQFDVQLREWIGAKNSDNIRQQMMIALAQLQANDSDEQDDEQEE